MAARDEHDIPHPPAPIARDALDTAVRHQVYVERVSANVAAGVKQKTARIGKVTTRKILDLDGELAQLTSDQLDALLVAAKKENLQVMLDALAELTPQLEQLGLYEGQFAAKSLGGITRGVRIRALKAGEAYQAALADPITATGQKLEVFLDEWTERQAKAVSNLIGKGYSTGWTNQQMIQAINGTKAAGYADGIVANAGTAAEAVVRTAVQHVASAARMETWARNSDVVTGYRFIATLDGKTTQICRSLDGRIFKLGEGPVPPLHIRCRSTTVAEVSDEFAFLDEGATRSSATGYVDANQTYYGWLKNQPAEFQADAIGETRAKLLRDGGLSAEEFARLNLGRNFQPMTLDEMRKKEPTAFKKAGI